MDVGSKHGSGGIASKDLQLLHRKKLLNQIALQSLDVSKDPYISRHGDHFECKLCLTIHNSENGYLMHAQGKKHQNELLKRQNSENTRAKAQPAPGISVVVPKVFVKIGKPGYKLTKIHDRDSQKLGLLINVKYPHISPNVKPLYRLMGSFEQKVERASPYFQYLVFAAEPYETIAIRLPSKRINHDSIWTYFDRDSGEHYLQFLFA